jgi:hypothetical protein
MRRVLIWLDVESAPVQEMIRYLVNHHVAVTSTLAAFEGGYGNARPAEDTNRERQVMTWQAWRMSRLKDAGARFAHVDRMLEKEMLFEHDFVKAGGTLLAGSDPTGDGSIMAGFADQREVELLVEAGFTPVEAMHIATQNGAEFLGIGGRVGTISLGKQADLVVVNGNPAQKVSDIRNVEIIFRKGVGYSPTKLLAGVDGVVGLED